MSLVVVGTVAFDQIETPFGKAEKIVGGAATYIGWAASYFTTPVQLVSVIGSDFPQSVLRKMEQRGMNTEGIQLMKGEKSFFWAGRYHDNMNQRDTLDTQLNVLADFNPVLPASYRDAQYLMLGNLTPSVQMQVIEQMNSRPKLVAMDTMNFWMDVAWDSLLEVIGKVDMLIINDEEARQLSGEYSLKKAAAKIHEFGPPIIVIKKGEHGALLFCKGETFFAPALLLEEVYDPTGAGDTFAGGLMGYLAKSDDLSFANLKRGIIYGSAMASFCVEKFGTEKLEDLTDEEVAERVEQFRNLTHFDLG